MAGGGSGSSAIEYPGYMEAIHSAALYGVTHDGETLPYNRAHTSGSLFGLINAGVTGVEPRFGPYKDYATNLYNPTADLASIKAEIDDFDDMLDVTFDDAALDNEVISFEQQLEDVHFRGINTLTGQLASVNAVNSTAFVLGLVLLESNRLREVSHFRTRLELDRRTARLAGKQVSVSMHTDHLLKKIIGLTDHGLQLMELHDKHMTWGIELYRPLGNFLGALNGSAIANTQGMSKTQSALVGALGGGALGYAAGGALLGKTTILGMAGGPFGMIAGALLGIGGALLLSD